MAVGLLLAGCENSSYSTAPTFALFETSAGVVYRINQRTGELEVVTPEPCVAIHSGEVLHDPEGRLFRYLGNGRVEPIDKESVGTEGRE